MFINLNHKSLKIYEAIRELTKEVYPVSMKLPAEEKLNMVQQIRRAALSVKLNLAEDQPGNHQTNEDGFTKLQEALL